MFRDASKSYYKLFDEHKIEVIENFNTSLERKRFSYSRLIDYANSEKREKVCALVGLRRTGKTTEMLQCAEELSRNGKKVLFLSINEPPETDLLHYPEKLVQISDIYNIIKDAQEEGYQAVFIDEITYVNDFLYANALANVYARKTPIYISGTDSLGFEIAEQNALYDRMVKIPTSYIPFKEFQYLLPDKSLDDYIRFGGTLHDESPYKTAQNTREYLNSAIAGNIIHALKFEEVDREYSSIADKYNSGELKGAIQKLANKAGQNIAIRAIRKEYESAAIRTTLRNIAKGKDEERLDYAYARKSSSLKRIEEELRTFFDIKLNSELTSTFDEKDYSELKRYLFTIGVLRQIPVYSKLSSKEVKQEEDKEILLQPGMLYCHAKEALNSLTLHEEVFEDWQIDDKAAFMKRLDNQTKGDILESLILFDTYTALPEINNVNDKENYYVSKLRLENVVFNNKDLSGKEVDLLIRCPQNKGIYLFEVKYSEQIDEEQTTHLKDETFINYIESFFDEKVIERVVIYNGPTDLQEHIKYINAEEYLSKIYNIDRLEKLFVENKYFEKGATTDNFKDCENKGGNGLLAYDEIGNNPSLLGTVVDGDDDPDPTPNIDKSDT